MHMKVMKKTIKMILNKYLLKTDQKKQGGVVKQFICLPDNQCNHTGGLGLDVRDTTINKSLVSRRRDI